MAKSIEDQLDAIAEEVLSDLDGFARGVQSLQYDPIACQHTAEVSAFVRKKMAYSPEIERLLSSRYKG